MSSFSEFYSDDKTKKAVVTGAGHNYVIYKYVNGNMIGADPHPNKSLQAVEDIAEDWVNGN